MHNICFKISLFQASTCFEHHVLKVRRSKLYYTASGIITPIGGRPVHRLREDTRGCIVQFWPPDDEHMCSKRVEVWRLRGKEGASVHVMKAHGGGVKVEGNLGNEATNSFLY